MLEQLSIQQRFRVLLIFSLACFALCGYIVYRTLSEIRVNGPIYESIMQGQDLVADILPPPEYLLEAYLVTLQMETAGDGARLSQLAARLHQLEDGYQQRYQYWRRAQLQGQLADKFLLQSHALALRFYGQAFDALLPALQRGDRAASARVLAQLAATYESQRHIIDDVVVLARQRNRMGEAAARQRIDVMGVTLATIFALTVAGFVFIFRTVQRSIAEPLLDAVRITKKIAAGDWSQQLYSGPKDEASNLLASIREIVKNTQKEMLKSEKMAALGALVAGVSHELNTPVGNGLMAVSTISDDLNQFRIQIDGGLRRSVLDEFLVSVQTGTDIATRNLQRAADLVSSFKQVAVDRASAQRRSFLLDQVVRETHMTMQPMLKRAPCRVLLDIPAAIKLSSFPGPLGQVIANMLENAVKHAFDATSADGTVTLAARLLDDGRRVSVKVIDNGKGIPQQMQAHVFEPFFTTRLGQGGSGLGLHIAHNIVYEVLGGTVGLVSKEGQGTVFEIQIPLVAPEDRVAA